ncbi:MAG TPA: DUF6600 domain-containing protein [Ramlibacter sp.]|nr:DUF6600 domain-containing protein [Ramlibacter sp.]
MSSGRLLHRLSSRLLPLLVAGFAAATTFAQTDPPARVARLNHSEGAVTFSTTGDNEWTDAEVNRPLTRGDRLWTDKGARAEIQVGSSAVRMDGHTQLEILTLDDQSTQLSVTQGTVYVRVRSLPEGENFEVDTPNLAYRAAYPGDYRIDVDAARGVTRVTIHSGTGAVYGEAGESLPLGGGQQITFKARNLAQLAVQESPPQDNFDRWAADRNRREDQSVAARYVPREVVGYQQLDAAGQWSQDATHGPVWIPQGTPANWAPYRHGRWEWIGPWGWTWIDDAAWGFATSHYGRWAMVGSRWAWVPGRMGLRPVYAPALVAFIGGSSGGISWTATLAGGKPGVAWFPLAPGEAWQPGYRASPVYMSNLNRNLAGATTAAYAHQRRPDALTAIPAEDFNHGKPARGSWLRVAGNILGSAQVVPPPPMPAGARERTVIARAPVPAPADVQKVATPPPPEQQQGAELAKAAEQVKAQQLQQAKAAEQLKIAAEQAAKAQQLAQAKAVAEQAKQKQAKAAAEEEKAQQAKADEKPGWFQQLRTKFAEFMKPVDPVKAAQQVQSTQQAQLAEIAKAAERARRTQASTRETTATAPEKAQAAVPVESAETAESPEQTRSARRAARLAEREKASKPAAVAKAAPAARAPVRVVEAPKRAEPTRREQLLAKRAEGKREQLAKRELAKKELVAKREQQQSAKRELVAKREQGRREEVARRAEHAKREALAQRENEIRRVAHLEQARRIADRDAQALREQRTKREEQQRREEQARELAQREAWQKKQQALAEQWRRDQQAWEQQQQQVQRARGVRPDLRNERPAQPEVWQRGIPILTPGRTS